MNGAVGEAALEPLHVTHELLRKSVHIAFGLFALTLRWLSWETAAAMAAIAVLGNILVLHRLLGRRIARDARGYDAGIVFYPLAVMILIITFRNRLEIAGAAWAILAFGDGFATLAGRFIRGPRLPWHPGKSWSGLVAFVAFGFAGAHAVFLAIQTAPMQLPVAAVILVAVVVAGLVESLPTNVDDNLTVPFAAAVVLWTLVLAESWPHAVADRNTAWWLAGNALLAVAGFVTKSVNLSGLIGGLVLGAVIILFAGWELYVVLLVFFVVGTTATKVGYRRKAERGLAQEGGGRRGFSHAFANVGVSAILAVMSAAVPAEYARRLWLAAAAALATAAADTTGSEVGQLAGRTAFLPLSLRRVPPGTEGAISMQGTLAGLVAGLVVAVVASLVSLGRVDPSMVMLITGSAFAASLLESIVGSFNGASAKQIPNGVLNFFNTLAGAMIAGAVG